MSAHKSDSSCSIMHPSIIRASCLSPGQEEEEEEEEEAEEEEEEERGTCCTICEGPVTRGTCMP
jgi:hypothetical protein